MDYAQIRDAYTAVKKTCKNGWRSEAASQAIIDLAVTSLKFLTAECEQIALHSLVPSKAISHFYETMSLPGLRTVPFSWSIRSWLRVSGEHGYVGSQTPEI